MAGTCEQLSYNQLSNIPRLVQEYDKCTFVDFTFSILINDFKNDLTNCIFRGECPNYDTLMIVMTVCYAYCLLKCCILIMVCFYQNDRVKSIQNNIRKNNPNEPANQDQQNNQNQENNQNVQNNQNQPNNEIQQSNQNKFKKQELPQDSIDELQTYQTSIQWNIRIEIAMALRDFFLFRGLGYFTSYLYEVIFVYKENGQYKCISPTMNPCPQVDQVQFYLSSADICVNRYPFFDFSGETDQDQQYAVMYIYIIIWILTESIASSILFFNTQVLSFVNEGGKEPKEINRSIKHLSYIFFAGQIVVFCILIFYFQIRLYFRFQSQEVLIFYLVWKSLGFILLFDQYNKKKCLSKKLCIDIAYDKEMNWVEKEKNNYEEAQKKCNNSTMPTQNNVISESSRIRAEQNNIVSMKLQYLNCLETIHKNLSDQCKIKQQEQTKKIQFQWDSYLFFVLTTLFIGIVGLSLCLIHFSINYNSATTPPNTDIKVDVNQLNDGSFQFGKFWNSQWVYWVGFVFCMLESAIFEIFNSVLLLHSYYLQLFQQMAQPNQNQSLDTTADDSSSNQQNSENDNQ